MDFMANRGWALILFYRVASYNATLATFLFNALKVKHYDY